MSRMLSANPGLRSRFPHKLEFDSSTPHEIAAIAELFADKSNVTIAEDAHRYFTGIAEWLCTTPVTEFPQLIRDHHDAGLLIDIAANGRYARNVLSASVVNMKSRVATDPTIDMLTAEPDVVRRVIIDDMRAAINEVLTAHDIHIPPIKEPATPRNP
jgi:hypothetical protein